MNNRENWINSKIHILTVEGNMPEHVAKAYLTKICEAAEAEGDSYDNAVFKAWQNLGKIVHETAMLVHDGVEKDTDKLQELIELYEKIY